MAEIASLWVGNKMTKIQEVCLSSFLYYGHDITLFTYGKRDDVPKGIKCKEASDIIPYDEVGQIAHFADVFRYDMVNKTGMGWVDADTLCLTENWNFLDNYYAIIQNNQEIQNGIFRFEPNSDFLNYIVLESKLVDRSKSGWTDTNSKILNKAFEKFPEYKKYLVNENIVNGVDFENWEKLWNPNNFKEMIKLSKNIKSFSIYNEMVSRSNIDKNVLPKGSAIKYFANKFL